MSRTGRPPATGKHRTREELEAALLSDWGEGPPWKKNVETIERLAREHRVSFMTVRRIVMK